MPRHGDSSAAKRLLYCFKLETVPTCHSAKGETNIGYIIQTCNYSRCSVCQGLRATAWRKKTCACTSVWPKLPSKQATDLFLPICLSICPPVFLSICLSTCLSICPSCKSKTILAVSSTLDVLRLRCCYPCNCALHASFLWTGDQHLG